MTSSPIVLPSFVQLLQEAPHPVYYVDIPEDLDELLVWIYLTAKAGIFPLTLKIFGNAIDFDSTAAMVGFAVGVKRTSDVFQVAKPVGLS